MDTLYLVEGQMALKTSYENRLLAKSVPGYKWHTKEKAWLYPINAQVYDEITKRFPFLRVEAELSFHLAQLRERLAMAEEVKRLGDAPELPSKTRAYAHQRAACAFATAVPHCALLMEMGTGKSKCVVDLALYRWRNEGLRRLLVVCPKSVARVWSEEFAKHGVEPAEVAALDGSLDRRAEFLLGQPRSERLQVAVINYEATWRLLAEIAAWQPEMVVCDESHKIKDPTANQSKAVHKIGQLKSVRWRMILTGTPTPNNLLEIFSQYKFLDPTVFGGSWWAFKSRYGIWGGYGNHQLIGYRNKEELMSKIHSVAYRVTKAEALDLPETTQVKRYVDLELKTRQVYEQVRRDAIAVLESGEVITARIVLTQLLRLSQVTGGFVSTENGGVRQVGDEKLRALEDVLEDLDGKKVVMFCRFVPEIEAICAVLKRRGVAHAAIYGAVSSDERNRAIGEFQNGNLQAIVAQIATGGLGITLHAADTAVFYSMDYSYANHDQACARLHRVGQRNPVTYVYLVCPNTVDEEVFKAVRDKRNLAEEVDRWREILKTQKPHGG